jgi:Uma2 family endonuclease
MTPIAELDPARTRLIYDWAADRYLQSLPLEHFMESTEQSTQREITMESLALVRAIRPDFQVFSELLIQYPVPGEDPDEPARVVPDNMVIVWPKPLAPLKAFHAPLHKARPTLVLEYVSQSNRRKDYDDNYKKYERDLKVPYYLVFEPEKQTLAVFHLEKGKYVAIAANEAGRLAIPDLELEVDLVNRWVRFWHCGALLPLPGELLNQMKAKDDQLAASREQLRLSNERAAAAEAEITSLRDELAKAKGQH